MKLAVPSETDAGLESIRSGHFGHAPYFTVVEIEDGGTFDRDRSRSGRQATYRRERRPRHERRNAQDTARTAHGAFRCARTEEPRPTRGRSRGPFLPPLLDAPRNGIMPAFLEHRK